MVSGRNYHKILTVVLGPHCGSESTSFCYFVPVLTSNHIVSFPPWIEGGEEILEFSEAGEEFFRGGVKFFWIRQGGTQNCDTKIILKMILIQM